MARTWASKPRTTPFRSLWLRYAWKTRRTRWLRALKHLSKWPRSFTASTSGCFTPLNAWKTTPSPSRKLSDIDPIDVLPFSHRLQHLLGCADVFARLLLAQVTQNLPRLLASGLLDLRCQHGRLFTTSGADVEDAVLEIRALLRLQVP